MISNIERTKGVLGLTYLSMDFTNLGRNCAVSVGAAATLAKASSIAALAAIAIPFCFAATGFAYLVTGSLGIRNAIKEKEVALTSLRAAQESLQTAYSSLQTAQKSLREANGNLNHHTTKIHATNQCHKANLQVKEDEQKAEKAEQKAIIAQEKYNLAYSNTWGWRLFRAIGISQLATSFSLFISPATAHFLGYQVPSLIFQIGAKIGESLLIGSGILFFLRGSVMLYRGRQSYKLIYAIREDLKFRFKDDIKAFYNNEKLDPETLRKNIHTFLKDNCAIKDVKLNNSFLTSQAIYASYDDPNKKNGALTISDLEKSTNVEELITYLKALDKGLHGALLQEKTAEVIAISMIFGGIATLLAAGFSGGTSVVIINLVASAVFMLMECAFAVFDSSSAFAWLQERCYTTSTEQDWIKIIESKKPYHGAETSNNLGDIFFKFINYTHKPYYTKESLQLKSSIIPPPLSPLTLESNSSQKDCDLPNNFVL